METPQPVTPRTTKTRIGRNRVTDKETRVHLCTIYAYGSSWYHCTGTEFHRCGNTYIIQDASYTRSDSYFSDAKVQQYTHPRPHSIPSSTEFPPSSASLPRLLSETNTRSSKNRQGIPRNRSSYQPQHQDEPNGTNDCIFVPTQISERVWGRGYSDRTSVSVLREIGGYYMRGLLGRAVYNHH
ncbi:hypothetical protein VKT23_014078 [Stygiomarasmius scandens]|uniref:Uncharacterized protein n=1 Tax=Marasmiellus scandens TaxID=2682957 RepID=A0ABR1J2I6_9AGAR